MTVSADLAEANIRAKRWAKVACESGLIKGGANPEVSHSPLYPPASRWRIHELLKWGNVLGDSNIVDESSIVETECCVAVAPTWGELLHKYSMWARDENRVAYFRDRQLRGESMHRPPPDPPEWAEFRRQAAAVAQQAGERTAEWVRKAAWGDMRAKGFDDAAKFELAWQRAASMGLVPK